jgi:hypothetical protein
MHRSRFRHRFTAILGALIVLSLLVVPVSADHDWETYHWKRSSPTTIEATIPVVDNLSGLWDSYLTGDETKPGVIVEWNKSEVIELTYQPGTQSPKQCKPSAGTIQVCNAEYGNNGWLGLAQIWVSGGHISQGTAKQNDSYFNQARYDTPEWRRLVLCQEVAHTFGLDHQDVIHDNENLGSCMDYTNSPTENVAPDPEDMEQLLAMYDPNYTVEDVHSHVTAFRGHYDAEPAPTTTRGKSKAEDEVTEHDPKKWGTAIEKDEQGRPTLFERDFGADLKVFTFVIPVDRGPVALADNDGDGGRNDGDGGRNDGGKRDGGKNDGGKRDGGKRDGGKRGGHNH